MRFKKLLALICVVVLSVTMFVGLGNTASSKFSKKIKFSMNRIDGERAGKDAVYDFIAKKFNVEIEYLPVGWDNWEQKVNLWISSNQLPDVLWWDLRAARYAQFATWARQGAFKALPELTKYKNLNKVMSYMPAAEKFRVDKKRYMIPHYTQDPGMQGVSGVFFYYRKDWAAKLGFTQDVFTFEELQKYVKACIEKDPGGNGPGKTKGIVGPTWSVPDHIFMYETSPNFATYTKVNGKYVWGATLPETLEGMKIAKKLFDEGIVDQDFYTARMQDGETQFHTGKAAIMVGSFDAGMYNFHLSQFKRNHPSLSVEECEKAIAPMKVLGPHGRHAVQPEYGFWSVSSISPKVNAETLDRILTYMDWCSTNEAGELAYYGIKGKDWTVTNGKYQQLWGDNNEKRPPYMDYVAVYTHIGTNQGQFSFPNNLKLSDNVKKTVTSWVEWRKKAPQSVTVLDTDYDFLVSPLKARYGAFPQDVKNKAKELIVSSKTDEELEKNWNAWLKSMEPQVAPVLKEINDALK